MSEHSEILNLTSSLGLLVDARDWAGTEALFADTVAVDYTSLNGGVPQVLAPVDLVGGWADTLNGLKATQHLIGNHVIVIEGDAAHTTTNVTATHVAHEATGDRHWVVGGRYDFTLARISDAWRITGLRLTVAWSTGNQTIMTPVDD